MAERRIYIQFTASTISNPIHIRLLGCNEYDEKELKYCTMHNYNRQIFTYSNYPSLKVILICTKSDGIPSEITLRISQILQSRDQVEECIKTCYPIYNDIFAIKKESFEPPGSIKLSRNIISPISDSWRDIIPENFNLYVTQERKHLWYTLSSNNIPPHTYLTGIKGIGKSISLVYLALALRRHGYTVFHHRFGNHCTRDFLKKIIFAFFLKFGDERKESIPKICEFLSNTQDCYELLGKCLNYFKSITNERRIILIFDQVDQIELTLLEKLQNLFWNDKVIFTYTSNNQTMRLLRKQEYLPSSFPTSQAQVIDLHDNLLSTENIRATLNDFPELNDEIEADRERLIGTIPLLASIFVNYYMESNHVYQDTVKKYIENYVNPIILKKAENFLNNHENTSIVLDRFFKYLVKDTKNNPITEEEFRENLQYFDFNFVSFSYDSQDKSFLMELKYPFIKSLYLTKSMQYEIDKPVDLYTILYFDDNIAPQTKGDLYQKLFGFKMIESKIAHQLKFLDKLENEDNKLTLEETISCKKTTYIYSLIYFYTAQAGSISAALSSMNFGDSLLIVPCLCNEPASDLYRLTLIAPVDGIVLCDLFAFQLTINERHSACDKDFYNYYIQAIISNLKTTQVRIRNYAFFWVVPNNILLNQRNSSSGLINFTVGNKPDLKMNRSAQFTKDTAAYVEINVQHKNEPQKRKELMISQFEIQLEAEHQIKPNRMSPRSRSLPNPRKIVRTIQYERTRQRKRKSISSELPSRSKSKRQGIKRQQSKTNFQSKRYKK